MQWLVAEPVSMLRTSSEVIDEAGINLVAYIHTRLPTYPEPPFDLGNGYHSRRRLLQ